MGITSAGCSTSSSPVIRTRARRAGAGSSGTTSGVSPTPTSGPCAFKGFRPIGFPSLSPDGTRVAAVVREGGRLRVRVWDTASGEMRLDLGGPPAGPDQLVVTNRPVFSRDGRRIAAALNVGLGGTDGTSRAITVWDAGTGAVVRTISQGVDFRVVGLALSPDGRRLAATHGAREVRPHHAHRPQGPDDPSGMSRPNASFSSRRGTDGSGSRTSVPTAATSPWPAGTRSMARRRKVPS